jgi:NitT/TauT family transport system permease protein
MADHRTATSRSRLSNIALPLLGGVGLIAFWWLATVVFHIDSFILPSPLDVLRAFLRLPGYLLNQALVTMEEALIGFGIAAAGGLLVAILLATSKLVSRAMFPMLVALNAIPKLAVAPLLLIWLGFGWSPKVIMVIMISFFPIVVAAMAGLTATPADLGELAASLSASRWATFVKVRIPWALPQIFVGLKVAISLAVIGAVVSEFSGADKGLGFAVVASGQSSDTPLAFAAIVLLSLVSIGLFYLLVGLERLLLPWVRETSA